MSKQIRLAIIDQDRCKPTKCNNECQKRCPVEKVGKTCIEIEKVAKVSEESCIGCGLCVKVCPFKAVQIVNLPTQLHKNLFFSYGENSFRLYKMPLPKQGKICGYIGRNGVGKSTLLNILDGTFKPVNSSLSKGTELQKYFINLPNFKVKVKPQDVHTYFTHTTNTNNITVKECVVNLLNPNNPYHTEVVNTLDLVTLYDKPVTTLSGGELQRLVCSLTLLSDADIYIFDEFSNFLDVKQRLKVASMIQRLCSSKRYIFVVEHDMSVLDYVSDYISLIYGVPTCYGAVSLPYNTGDAVNMYFTGYIAPENMKFRDQPFTFKESLVIQAENNTSSVNSVVNYPEITVTYGDFQLKAEAGQLNQGTTLVLLIGENGVGKTSFLNELVQRLGLTVSYKTQYLTELDSYNSDLVQDVLYKHIRKAMHNSLFKSDVLVPLNLLNLLDRTVNMLSGGEKQRLALALCLGTDADVYFLDEPSASLDVEQRFVLTKMLKRFFLHNSKYGFVVEHDMLVVTSLGSEPNAKTVVFEKISTASIVYSIASKPLPFKTGMNRFLQIMDVTFRTDHRFRRPRINKKDSQKDKEQKANNTYFI